MNTTLVGELKKLLNEARELLACPDPDVEAWEGYGKRRETILARLGGMDFQVSEREEAEKVQDLLKEILQQDATVTEKLKARLISLREELSVLAKERRALRGYAPPRPALLFERCV